MTEEHDREGAKNPQPEEYPNVSDDPEPLPEGSSTEDREEHARRLATYTKEMREVYEQTGMKDEELWEDFITAFRPETIDSWSRSTATDWASFLRRRGIGLRTDRRKTKIQLIKEVLYWTFYRRRTSYEELENETQAGDRRIAEDRVGTDAIESTLETRDRSRGRRQIRTERPQKRIGSQPGNPGDSTPSSSSDESSGSDRWKDEGARRNTPPEGGKEGAEEYRGDTDRGMGVQGMMRAYVGKKKFTGAWHEDLDGCFAVFETMAKMCHITRKQKLEAIPVMLDAEALRLFSDKGAECQTYEDAVKMLGKWYNSSDKKSRILTAWQRETLSKELNKHPKDAEVDVFRRFVSKLTSLQQKLDTRYHGDHYLRDRLLTAVDIPEIQGALRDRLPHSSQQAINRVASKLSEAPRTSVTATVHFVGEELEDVSMPEAHYSLGRSFTGGARQNVKTYGRGGSRMRGGARKQLIRSWM